jgi:hypothetical protein
MEEKRNILSKKCWGKFDETNKRNVICQSSYFLFILGQENKININEIELNITKHLMETNLFKEMNSTSIIVQIIDKFLNYTIVNQLREANQSQFNWTCLISKPNCNESLSTSYKLHYWITLLTSRVTKLGTLMAWSNSYNVVSAYLKQIYSKLGNGTSEIDVIDLAMALTPEGFTDQDKGDFKKFETFDQKSNACWPGISSMTRVFQNCKTILLIANIIFNIYIMD